VDFHLERGLRLHTEPEHKNLYKWAINEIDADGKKIGLDQIPWQWSLYFTATSCVLSDSIEITQPLNFKFKVTMQDGTVTERESGGKETIDRRVAIQAQLRPGDSRAGYGHKEAATFKMFGADRAIKNFQLNIVQLTDPAEQELCTAWGCPSYTSEGADFIDETIDDSFIFYVAVKPEAFTRYVEKITNGSVDEIVLRVGKVDGFYSEWSPSWATDRLKVLTADREHKVTTPPDCQIEPPRLGQVAEFALFINRKLEFDTRALEPEAADIGTERAAPKNKIPPAVDPQSIQLLRSLRRAAWFVVSLLVLIFIATLLRR
jgi:hypothetical protein